VSEARQKFTAMTAELHRYAVARSEHRDELMLRLSEETERAAGEMAVMQTAPEQAALMTVLVRAIGARRALELGTFTGFGSIAIARGLPEDGYLLSCDVSEEWTAIARRYIAESGLAKRIEVRLGPALETLAALPDSDPFDFAFIDADKGNYPAYYEECVRVLRTGGLILIDNVFHGGRVLADTEEATDATEAIRQTNDRVAADDRVLAAMIGVADGVTVAVKL
jgi:caffeoyl-CoA O-methyltransferase